MAKEMLCHGKKMERMGEEKSDNWNGNGNVNRKRELKRENEFYAVSVREIDTAFYMISVLPNSLLDNTRRIQRHYGCTSNL